LALSRARALAIMRARMDSPAHGTLALGMLPLGTLPLDTFPLTSTRACAPRATLAIVRALGVIRAALKFAGPPEQ